MSGVSLETITDKRCGVECTEAGKNLKTYCTSPELPASTAIRPSYTAVELRPRRVGAECSTPDFHFVSRDEDRRVLGVLSPQVPS